MAATSRGSGNTEPHSLNGRLLASPMLACSSRSVMIWNSSSFFGGFDEFVDQLRARYVTDFTALLAGGQP
jgi:hypothetical protein